MKTILVKREKLNLNEHFVEAMIDLNLPIHKILKEAGEIVPIRNGVHDPINPLEGPSKQELAAIQMEKIKEGIVLFFKNFKLDEDKIHMEGPTSATISIGDGTTYVVFFSIYSYEPPTIQIESMKKVNYGGGTMETNV